MNVLDRFLRYAALDTQSDPDSDAVPSTEGQLAMLQLLGDELRALGATEIELRRGAYLTATIPASGDAPGADSASCEVAAAESIAAGCGTLSERSAAAPVIGFLAHVDTSPDAPGVGVKPCVSGDWVTTESFAKTVAHHPSQPTILEDHCQNDGGVPTLLGADDKAGVAAIVTAAERLLATDAPPHGVVRLAFTTDEEIGRGTQLFDTGHFGADFAYTVDGGLLGELQFENFNAAQAHIAVKGIGAHPGDARGKMVSALRVAMAIDDALPADQRAETTAGRDGFYHLTALSGTTERAEAQYIIRDFDRTDFEARKLRLAEIVGRVNEDFSAAGAGAELVISDQYRNMAEVLRRHPEAVDRAREAMLECGVEPVETPIRGGTDGARLTEIGLPCPNIFTGGENFHSTAERLHIPTLEKCVEVIVAIARTR